MNAQQLLAKLKAYPLALSLFGVAILLAGWAYYRDSGALTDAQAASKDASDKAILYNNNVTAGEKIDEHLAELTDDAKKFKDALINPSSVVLNEQYFLDIAKQAGVQIVNPTEGATDRGKDTSEPSVVTFTMGASGHWENIAAFLYGLQTGPHLLRVNMLHLIKSQQMRSNTAGVDSNRLEITLIVEVLGQ
jgi:hypothetical protein